MDFIAKHHGAVISFLAGNGNVYSYKHNGVEHHFPSIQMPPSTQQLTQMSIQSSHYIQQRRIPKLCRPCCCPAAYREIESVVNLSAFLPLGIRTRDLLSFIVSQHTVVGVMVRELGRLRGLFCLPHKHRCTIPVSISTKVTEKAKQERKKKTETKQGKSTKKQVSYFTAVRGKGTFEGSLKLKAVIFWRC